MTVASPEARSVGRAEHDTVPQAAACARPSRPRTPPCGRCAACTSTTRAG